MHRSKTHPHSTNTPTTTPTATVPALYIYRYIYAILLLLLAVAAATTTAATAAAAATTVNNSYDRRPVLPPFFSLRFVARSRLPPSTASTTSSPQSSSSSSSTHPPSTYTGTLYYHKNDESSLDTIMAIVNGDGGNQMLYNNGHMIVFNSANSNPICVQDRHHIPPTIPNIHQHMLDNAIPLDHYETGSTTMDAEVNRCIQDEHLQPWLVMYHGEPFVLCSERSSSSSSSSSSSTSMSDNVIIPRRLIGSSVVIDIDRFQAGDRQSFDRVYQHWQRKWGDANAQVACSKNNNNKNNEERYGSVVSESEQGPNLMKNSKANKRVDLATVLQASHRASRLGQQQQLMQQGQQQQQQQPLWFYDYDYACRLQWIKDDTVCGMLYRADIDEPVKTCVFLHGVGNSEADAGEPASLYPEYWGKIHLFTPQCKERIFVREESRLRGWDDLELQRSFCNVSLTGQARGDNIIKDKILFVHSMGNLILAGAIRNGLCDIDRDTTSWYEIQGPFRGSKAADRLQDICLKTGKGWLRPTPAIYYYVAEKGGYCMPQSNVSYLAYRTLSPGYESLADGSLQQLAMPRIKGAMCGESSFGLLSTYSPLLEALSLVVGYDTTNDGMVPLPSCHIDALDFNGNFTSKFFKGPLNHADGTCRVGDGHWGVDRKPCSYYTSRR